MRDDNHLLPEWIAYHYQVLPLRHLVVAADPDSVTSPKTILDRFRDKLGIEIVLWEDKDYRKKEDIVTAVQEKLQIETATEIPDSQALTEIHNRRQRNFVGQCLRYHKANGRSWVALTDSDEFIAFNNKYRRSSHIVDSSKRQQILPQAHETSNIMTFLNENPDFLRSRSWEGCLPMARTKFGSKVEEDDTDAITDLPGGFVRGDFTTLKYLYHKKIREFGKVMMDVRKFTDQELHPTNIFCIHRPIYKRCEKTTHKAFIKNDDMFSKSVFHVHDYIGSLKDYMRGNHVHRNTSKYHFFIKGTSEAGPNLETRKWLNAFIDNVGAKTAKDLLRKEYADDLETPYNEIADNDNDQPYCALLFFGLPRSFSELVLPSMKENIVDPNKECKIFFHTYNVTVSVEGNDTIRMKKADDSLHILKKLADSFLIESEDDFRRKRDLSYYRKFAPVSKGWTYPSSLDNMIRQWNSIESVWDVMSQYELDHSIKFRRVGLFRLDVKYVDQIDIVTDEAPAVIPTLMYNSYTPHNDYNDRMFYGVREFAKVWATDRFSSVVEYIEWQQTVQFEMVLGLMSESFLHFLLRKKWKIPIVERDICFVRVRGSGKIIKQDCDEMTPNSGVLVLGMPDRGNSLLISLLSEGTDFINPGNRMGRSKYRNAVLLNDLWLDKQSLSWDHPYKMTKREDGSFLRETFDPDVPCISNSSTSGCAGSISDYETNLLDEARFDLLRRSRPWILNDARFGITLKTWVKFLSAKSGIIPSILFIYREPLAVAKSLKDLGLIPDIRTGLKLWIFYNQIAISNSRGMCRVITSFESAIDNPMNEAQRIRRNIRLCGNNFSFRRPSVTDEQKINELVEAHGGHLEWSQTGNFSGNIYDCNIPSFKSNLSKKEELEEANKLFVAAMKVYCDMKNGEAFSPDYVWPSFAAEMNPISKIGNRHTTASQSGQQQHRQGVQNRSLAIRDGRMTKDEESKQPKNQEPASGQTRVTQSVTIKGTNQPEHTRHNFSKEALAMLIMLDSSVRKRLDLDNKADQQPYVPLTNFNYDDNIWGFKRHS